MHRMSVAALAGRRAEAEAIDATLAGLHKALFVESNPIPVKWALAEMARIGTGIRLPLTWLSDAAQPAVREAMHQAGIL
jgi:4-hydroxy-tetrahydrodipicolinate synthase